MNQTGGANMRKASGVLSTNYTKSQRGGHGHPTHGGDAMSDDRACANS